MIIEPEDYKNVSVGLDMANGFVKGACSRDLNPKSVDIYLNTLTVSNENEYKQFTSGVSTEEVYFINGEYYKVNLGKIKGLTHHNFTSRNDRKYKEPLWQTAFIIGVYRQIKDLRLDFCKLYVTTGLPANDDKKNSIKRHLKEVFENEHCVNGKKFTIEELFFIGQGSASFFNDLYQVDEEGNTQVNRKYLAETAPLNNNSVSKVLYVDFGFGTRDSRLTVDYSLQPDSDEGPGMVEVWESIIKELTVINGNDDEETKERKEANEWLSGLKIHNIEDQIREGKEIRKGEIAVDISEAFEKKMYEYAKETIRSLYIGGEFDNQEYDQVRFVGGGSIPLEKYLVRAIDEYHATETEKKIYKFVSHPQTTNCIGYTKFGLASAKKYLQKN